MNKFGIKGVGEQNLHLQETLDEIVAEARNRGVKIEIFYFNSDRQVLLNKETVYILVGLGIAAGYIGRALV